MLLLYRDFVQSCSQAKFNKVQNNLYCTKIYNLHNFWSIDMQYKDLLYIGVLSIFVHIYKLSLMMWEMIYITQKSIIYPTFHLKVWAITIFYCINIIIFFLYYILFARLWKYAIKAHFTSVLFSSKLFKNHSTHVK